MGIREELDSVFCNIAEGRDRERKTENSWYWRTDACEQR